MTLYIDGSVYYDVVEFHVGYLDMEGFTIIMKIGRNTIYHETHNMTSLVVEMENK